MTATVRPATAADLPAITAIYGEAVTNGTATFELDAPDEAEMRRRFGALADGGFPYLAATDGVDGRLLGYAYAGPYRPRAAYGLTVEDAVYVAADAQRRGVGGALLAAVVEAAAAARYRQMVAIIGDSRNTASIALHAAGGFRMVGTFTAVGRKHGRWLDTVLMQRALGAAATTAPAREPGA
jgi:phosphinothricin acetyltransferase